MLRSIGLPELLRIFAMFFAIVPFWKIFSKAGYPLRSRQRTPSLPAVDGGFVEYDFLEPLGIFHGGAILYKHLAFVAGYRDTHGTALAAIRRRGTHCDRERPAV